MVFSKSNQARLELNKHLNKMADIPDQAVAGNAALSICESLLIAMRDLNVISEKVVRNILVNAAAAHHEASKRSDDPAHHEEAAELIERMLAARRSLPCS